MIDESDGLTLKEEFVSRRSLNGHDYLPIS
jgi:hypothetical protein